MRRTQKEQRAPSDCHDDEVDGDGNGSDDGDGGDGDSEGGSCKKHDEHHLTVITGPGHHCAGTASS